MKWTTICPYPSIPPERGVAALVDGAQVAVFRLHNGGLHAIGNVDPVSGAAVLSRGIVGTRGSVPTVASPMHKQVYDLRTGECLDLPGVRVAVYQVRRNGDLVEVAGSPAPPGGGAGPGVAGG
jgi:nitrite reductase (NADH) small subunit